jgi:hypothetical protein
MSEAYNAALCGERAQRVIPTTAFCYALVVL